MSRPKRWYDSEAADALRVVSRTDQYEAFSTYRWKHPRVMPTVGECLAYPLSDGPGLGLLIFFPPAMWALSLPVFDFVAVIEPMTKSDWALGLLVLPIFIPLLFSFGMTFGYILLFLGHVLVASAMGENEHPRWPEWQPDFISEGIGRWFWAAIFGVGLGGLPIIAYWVYCGQIDLLDWVVFAELLLIGAGFAQMALAASLMHETILAANPITVGVSIVRIGWDYVKPCLVGSVTLVLAGLGVYGLLFRMPRMWMEAVSLWGFWVLLLYAMMVVMRMLGLTYHAHAMELVWFRRRPRWASSRLHGRLYANS